MKQLLFIGPSMKRIAAFPKDYANDSIEAYRDSGIYSERGVILGNAENAALLLKILKSKRERYSQILKTMFIGGSTYNVLVTQLESPLPRANTFINRGPIVGKDLEKTIGILRTFFETDLINQARLYLCAPNVEGGFGLALTGYLFEKKLAPFIIKTMELRNLEIRVLSEFDKHKVHLNVSIEDWETKETNRYNPKTYRETVKDIVLYSLLLEICDYGVNFTDSNVYSKNNDFLYV